MEIKVSMKTKRLFELGKKLEAYYGDPKEFYRIFQDWYFAEMRAVYGSRGSRIGAKWPRLDDQYFRWKRKKRYPGRAHMLTRRTRKALTGGRGGGRRIRKSKKRMEIDIGSYPGFKDSKHQTSHPFYIINHFRPLQYKKPTNKQLDALDRDFKRDIEEFDRKLGTR